MNRIRIAIVIVALLNIGFAAWQYNWVSNENTSNTGIIAMPESPSGKDLAIVQYAEVLNDHVNGMGMVDYAGLQANPGDLNVFLASVANLDPMVFDTWSESERIAFWCNVYNAYTLKAIVDHYPIKSSFFRSLTHPKNSIRQIAGVWDTLRWPVMGKRMTLDAIEHETLRVEFDEPRIHAALVCAAMGCPPLRNEPYTGDRLDDQLSEQMVDYLGDAERFRIDRESNTVHLSSILKWYGEDFVKSFGVDEGFGGRGPVERAVLNALTPHVNDDDANYLRTATYSVRYLEYDWSLNEQ